jgi:hypothetical protein
MGRILAVWAGLAVFHFKLDNITTDKDVRIRPAKECYVAKIIRLIPKRLFPAIALALSAGLYSFPAHAYTTISLVGAADWASPSVDPNPGNVNAKLGLGGGALLGFALSSPFRLEIGALYVDHKSDFTAATSPTTYQGYGVEVPVLLRLTFNRYISFGVGGYYAQFVDKLSETSDSTGLSSQISYSGAGFKDDDFGLVGSVAIHIPVTYTVDFTVDGRYNYGLNNLISDSAVAGADTWKTRDIQVLAGFTFHIMH